MTFTLQNLTSGQNYLFQGWVNDSRGSYSSRTEYLSGGGANSDTFHFGSSSPAGSLGYYVIGTFAADSTAQDITVQGVTGNVAQLTAFQLRAIPEPATWALLAFSLTSVMVLRRRRA
ncbi:MAG: PEP-CTERM sorting domain-containing protein [Terrimicrobiaceae bacterium]